MSKERKARTDSGAEEFAKPIDLDAAFAVLRRIFADQPDLLRIVTLQDIQSQETLDSLRERADLLRDQVNLYVVGRTGAGKTSLGNRLFGAEAMASTGYMDCTDAVGWLRLKSKLWYFDTPGAGSDENYENVTRLALRLRQIEDVERKTGVTLRDYSDASVTRDGVVTGVEESRLTDVEWTEQITGTCAPDVMIFVISPHMHFIRDDKAFLRDVLREYGAKVVVALNIWQRDGVRLPTPQNLHDARKGVEAVYAGLYPDGSLRPRFVELDALTGSGIHELTIEICEVVPQEKLGRIESVLTGDLKEHAKNERSRRFRETVNRIAARLALHRVDQRAGEENVVRVIAAGLVHLGVLTFQSPHLVVDLTDQFAASVDEQVRRIRAVRTKEHKSKEAQTVQHDIIVKEPIFDYVETESVEKRTIEREIVEARSSGAWAAIKAMGGAAVDHTLAIGQGKRAHDRARSRMLDRMVTTDTRTETETVDVPVRKIEQQIAGYNERVVDTVTKVVGYTERVFTEALRGGLPAIGFLVALGRAVERYCSESGTHALIQQLMEQEQQDVELVLDRLRDEIKPLVDRGASAETDITGVLNAAFART
jgi:hypothetical protein